MDREFPSNPVSEPLKMCKPLQLFEVGSRTALRLHLAKNELNSRSFREHLFLNYVKTSDIVKIVLTFA